jgi:L-serine dehydratase
VRAELFGSLGATGHGHGSVKAVLLGLEGEAPESTDPRAADPRLAEVRATGRLRLDGTHEIACDLDTDVVLHRRKTLPFHSNGMRFTAWASAEPQDGEEPLHQREYYSVGGGFVLDQDEVGENVIVPDHTPVTYPFTTGDQLLARCAETGLPISGVMMANELSWRTEAEVREGLLHLWQVMQEPIEIQPRRPNAGTANHTEVYLPEQVVAFFTGDRPALVTHMSSGNGQEWRQVVTIDVGEFGNEHGSAPIVRGWITEAE